MYSCIIVPLNVLFAECCTRTLDFDDLDRRLSESCDSINLVIVSLDISLIFYIRKTH